MLILSRRIDEEIVIVIGGHEIIVRLLSVHRIGKPDERCRLGIIAPRDLPVHRGEVQRMIDSTQTPKQSQD